MYLQTMFSVSLQEKPVWLLEGLIPKKSLAVLYGKPKSGKSLLALDWSLTLAHRETPVIYIAAEGLGGYGVRIKSWHEKKGIPLLPDVPMWFSYGLDLTFGANISELIESAKTKKLLEREVMYDDGEYYKTAKPVGLVVIDTLSRCIPGGDENDAEAMSDAIRQIDRIREELKCAVLVIHHQTKDSPDNENARERGSSALRAAADVMLHVGTKSRQLSVNAARDFESGAKWGYTITPQGDSVVATLTNNNAIKEQEVGPVQGAILKVLEDGETLGPSEISKRTDIHSLNISLALAKLVRRGLVVKEDRGLYKLAPKP